MLKQDYAQQRLLWRPLRRLAVGGGWPWAAAGYCGGWLLRRLAAQPRCGKRVQGTHPPVCHQCRLNAVPCSLEDES